MITQMTYQTYTVVGGFAYMLARLGVVSSNTDIDLENEMWDMTWTR